MQFRNFVGIAILLTAVFTIGDAASCLEKFENIDTYKKTHTDCITKLKLKESDVAKSGEDIIKMNFDDKCLMKCVFEEMKLITADGTFDKVEIEKDMKVSGPPDKQTQLIEMSAKCVDSTEKEAKSMEKEEGGLAKNICKYSAKFHHCIMENEKSIC